MRVERIKFVLFCLTGLMAGIAAVLLTSRLGSTRPSIAQGWELEVITMVVLGGVSHPRRRRLIIGVVLAAFIMGLVTFGLGLLNVPGIVMSIFIGLLLIVVIALPIVWRRIKAKAGSVMAEKYAFRMQLNPGMEAEYMQRHDEIWPELVDAAAARPAYRTIRSISTKRPTSLFGVLWRSGRTTPWPICRTIR